MHPPHVKEKKTPAAAHVIHPRGKVHFKLVLPASALATLAVLPPSMEPPCLHALRSLEEAST